MTSPFRTPAPPPDYTEEPAPQTERAFFAWDPSGRCSFTESIRATSHVGAAMGVSVVRAPRIAVVCSQSGVTKFFHLRVITVQTQFGAQKTISAEVTT